jgi:hypothetical protein
LFFATKKQLAHVNGLTFRFFVRYREKAARSGFSAIAAGRESATGRLCCTEAGGNTTLF